MMKTFTLFALLGLWTSSFAAQKDLDRVRSMTQDQSGNYSVVCIDGSIETRTAEEIRNDNVCFFKVPYLPRTTNDCQRDDQNFTCQISVKEQQTSNRNKTIYIALVVDNSGSMMPHQTNLAKNIKALFDDLSTKANWEGALFTTDKNDALVFEDKGPKQNRSKNWANEILKVGTNGSATEQGIQSILAHLNESTMEINEDNNLHLIFVSDEDDQSDMSAKAAFVELVTKYNLSADRIYSYNLLHTKDSNPSNCKNLNNFDYKGSKFESFAKMTEGKLYDLCSNDLSEELSKIKSDILKLNEPVNQTLRMKLTNNQSYKSVKVILNGVEIPKISNKLQNWYIFSGDFSFENQALLNLNTSNELRLEFTY